MKDECTRNSFTESSAGWALQPHCDRGSVVAKVATSRFGNLESSQEQLARVSDGKRTGDDGGHVGDGLFLICYSVTNYTTGNVPWVSHFMLHTIPGRRSSTSSQSRSRAQHSQQPGPSALVGSATESLSRVRPVGGKSCMARRRLSRASARAF